MADGADIAYISTYHLLLSYVALVAHTHRANVSNGRERKPVTVRGDVSTLKHWIDHTMMLRQADDHPPAIACLKTLEGLCDLMLQPATTKAFELFYQSTSENSSIMAHKKNGQVNNEYAYQPAALNALLASLGLKRRRAGGVAGLHRVGPCWRPEPEEEEKEEHDNDNDDEDGEENQGSSSEEEDDEGSSSDHEKTWATAGAVAAGKKKGDGASDLSKGWNPSLHADLVKLIVKSVG